MPPFNIYKKVERPKARDSTELVAAVTFFIWQGLLWVMTAQQISTVFHVKTKPEVSRDKRKASGKTRGNLKMNLLMSQDNACVMW